MSQNRIINIVNRISGKFLILLLALAVGSGALTACGSVAEKTAGNGAAGRAGNGSAANEKATAGNKTAENKLAAEAPQQAALVEIYDGRQSEETPDAKASATDAAAVEAEFKRSESAISQKLGDKYCIDAADAKVDVYNSVEGAFTKPDSKQTAYLYALCELGRGFGVGGILIVENGAVAAHYAGQISWGSSLTALPDINKNGTSEIVMAGGGSGQGYTEASIDILDFKGGNLDFLGEAETYSDNSGAVLDDSKALATAYKVSAAPGATPTFFREAYEKKGTAKTWSLSKKSEKFSLKKDEALGFTKIN